MMSDEMKKGWWSFDLPGYRPHPKRFATYSLFSYEDLPPILEKLDNDFEWLKSQTAKEHSLFVVYNPNKIKPDLNKLARLVSVARINLPESFITFMDSLELQKRVRSCTDCYLYIADHVIKTKGSMEGYLVHFLSDSQGVGHWYIHVDHGGNHCVVTSPNPLEEEGANREIDIQEEEIWLCAPSFTEFIYRFWLENEIWFALAHDKRTLTEKEQAYVNGYSQKSK